MLFIAAITVLFIARTRGSPTSGRVRLLVVALLTVMSLPKATTIQLLPVIPASLSTTLTTTLISQLMAPLLPSTPSPIPIELRLVTRSQSRTTAIIPTLTLPCPLFSMAATQGPSGLLV